MPVSSSLQRAGFLLAVSLSTLHGETPKPSPTISSAKPAAATPANSPALLLPSPSDEGGFSKLKSFAPVNIGRNPTTSEEAPTAIVARSFAQGGVIVPCKVTRQTTAMNSIKDGYNLGMTTTTASPTLGGVVIPAGSQIIGVALLSADKILQSSTFWTIIPPRNPQSSVASPALNYDVILFRADPTNLDAPRRIKIVGLPFATIKPGMQMYAIIQNRHPVANTPL